MIQHDPGRSLIAAALVWLAFSSAALAADVSVFAAASLRDALDEVAGKFTEETGHNVTLSYAGSSALARQISYGAPADVFISANTAWMEDIEARGLIAPGTRVDLLGNRLVLIAALGRFDPIALSGQTDLNTLLDGGKLAMALVDAVPAGLYGKASLLELGLWAPIEKHVVQTDNVRAALVLVSLGAATLGVVYATDAHADARVDQIAEFPATSHPEIIYTAARLKRATAPQAQAFLDYLSNPTADKIFENRGFLSKGP
ncbi:MAG: molybdate ABC transporter substrate-binding protein [Pseudomonadota bacterium]